MAQTIFLRRLRLTRYQLAHWSGRDAGNRSMRAADRKVWNEQDYRIAVEEMNRILDEGNHAQPTTED